MKRYHVALNGTCTEIDIDPDDPHGVERDGRITFERDSDAPLAFEIELLKKLGLWSEPEPPKPLPAHIVYSTDPRYIKS